MKRRIRRGFTLVELLVVISIIGMLAALILPAVNSAREAARRNTCMSNMRQVGMAVIGHETNKGHYPGYKNVQATRSFEIEQANGRLQLNNTPVTAYPQAVSWVFPLLSFMERNDIVQNYGDGGQDADGFLKGVYPDLTLSVMICPSDIRAATESRPVDINGTQVQLRGGSSFVANTGMADSHSALGVMDVNEGISPDYPQNGVFHNHYPYASSDNEASTFDNSIPMKVIKISSSAINDGVSTTLMLSENADGGLWHDAEEFQNGFIWQPGLDGDNLASFTSPNLPTAATLMTGDNIDALYRINEEAGNIDALGSVVTTQYTFARPSSLHPGGVNTVFCDGHAQFIQESVDPRVWAQLMSPYGARAGIPTPTGIVQLAQDDDFQIFATYVLDEDTLNNQ